MALPKTREGSPAATLRMIEAYLRDGHYMAGLASRFLDGWFQSLGRKIPAALPAEFLMELSAVIRIAIWQQNGSANNLAFDFPPAEELLDALLQRLFERPTSFGRDPQNCPAPLQRKIVWIWFTRCSWSATEELGTDIALQPADEDALLRELADLVWKHRHLGKQKVNSDAC